MSDRSGSFRKRQADRHPSEAGTVNLFESNRLTEPYIWYVSYRSNIMPASEREKRVARATRKFTAEAEAKQFAHESVAKGWSAIAGTLNPHTPKKMVSSHQILDWIDGKI